MNKLFTVKEIVAGEQATGTQIRRINLIIQPRGLLLLIAPLWVHETILKVKVLASFQSKCEKKT